LKKNIPGIIVNDGTFMASIDVEWFLKSECLLDSRAPRNLKTSCIIRSLSFRRYTVVQKYVWSKWMIAAENRIVAASVLYSIFALPFWWASERAADGMTTLLGCTFQRICMVMRYKS
jgi:hypothetical protein